MKKIYNAIRSTFIYFIIFIDTVVCSIIAFLFGLFNPYSNWTSATIKTWAKIILWVSGVKLEIEGIKNIDTKKSYVFTSNHMSSLDIPVAVLAIPQTARFIAKKELFRIPILSQGMRASGMLRIDRGNSEQAKKVLDRAITTIKEGCSVIIFPEGTRSKTGEIQNFKKGGFILAMNGKIPILPMAISGAHHIVTKGYILRKSGQIKVKFLKEIGTEGIEYEKRNELVDLTRQQIIAGFEPDFNKEEEAV